MQITLYRRSYPIAGSPVAHSFAPDQASQRHTFTAEGKVYESSCREVQVTVPDGAKLDVLRNVLCWTGPSGAVRSTAQEVFDLATAGERGFRLADASAARA
ncbi:unnamed protein product [Gemmataceae bacterium]|nr:unnamed protein product [Gemmataceae bacterium]VTT98626.1 unnamed protein product [Gemmataceae bacterium]